MTKEGRGRIWIAPFQTRLFIRFCGYWLLYQVSLWNCLFVWRLWKDGKGDVIDQYGRFFAEFYPLLLCSLIIVPFFAWDAVRFSHRVVGPIYRFQQAIKALAEGRSVRPVKLRQGDYLTEFQDDFNAMLSTLQRQGVIGVEFPIPSQDGGMAQEAGLMAVPASEQRS
jgi:hypothetical protein